jgi:hypothetical protein
LSEERGAWEPLNQSAAAFSGSFAPTCRFENLEIRKGFLRFPNLNLEQNPSLTALAIESELPLTFNRRIRAIQPSVEHEKTGINRPMIDFYGPRSDNEGK